MKREGIRESAGEISRTGWEILSRAVTLPAQPGEKRGGHRGGSAPDITLRRAFDCEDWHHVVAALVPPPHPAKRLRAHQVVERDGEDRLHLVRGEHHLGLRREQTHKWAHTEVGGRDVHLLELPYHLDQIRAQVYLLFRLAQRGLQQRVVGRVHAASGKRDLACVIREMILPHRVDEMRPLRLEQNRYENGRSPRVRAGWGYARPPLPRLHVHGREALVDLAPGVERPPDRFSQARRQVFEGETLPGFQSVSVGVHPLIIIHGADAASFQRSGTTSILDQVLLLSTASISRAIAAVQDCSWEPRGSPVNGSKYSAKPLSASCARVSRRI